MSTQASFERLAGCATPCNRMMFVLGIAATDVMGGLVALRAVALLLWRHKKEAIKHEHKVHVLLKKDLCHGWLAGNCKRSGKMGSYQRLDAFWPIALASFEVLTQSCSFLPQQEADGRDSGELLGHENCCFGLPGPLRISRKETRNCEALRPTR